MNDFLNTLFDLSKIKFLHILDLQFCLTHFIESEEYEKCAEIRDIIISKKFNDDGDSYSEEFLKIEEEIMTWNSSKKKKKKLINKHQKLLLKDMKDGKNIRKIRI